MKYIIYLFALSPFFLNAQEDPEQPGVKRVIDQLFDGMRANDSLAIAPLFVRGASLSSIYRDKTGKVTKSATPVSQFITAVGTPHEEVWDEVIWSYDIKIDEPMASAWTEYTFYRGDKMSHCGVNVFELIKIEGSWMISGITDTRRTTGCITRADREVNSFLNAWHKSAAEADEDVFFGSMTEDGVYIGTDPSERWTRKSFEEWGMKYFERESAWSFTPISRTVEFDKDEEIGWFDELLETWMGPCRGSGVVIKTPEGWKIKHYHLAIAVPNDVTEEYIKLLGKELPARGK